MTERNETQAEQMRPPEYLSTNDAWLSRLWHYATYEPLSPLMGDVTAALQEIDGLRSTVATLTEQLREEQERADRLYKDRYDLLGVKTTDGMTASEWVMRTAAAESARDAALAELARLRWEVIEHLREIEIDSRCHCEDAWTDRGLHAPECRIGINEEVRDALAILTRALPDPPKGQPSPGQSQPAQPADRNPATSDEEERG